MDTANLSSYFSPSYKVARERFKKAAESAGAKIHSVPLSGYVGREGEELATDFAWFGSPNPKRVLIHSCGIHGVEGYAGSAIQLYVLSNQLPKIPEDGAIVFVHPVNPFGMSWWRRWNENNVDLNRNCLTDEEWKTVTNTNQEYKQIDAFINPTVEPTYWGLDFFTWTPYYYAMYGGTQLKQMLAGGQYFQPKGIFYGGQTVCEQSIRNIYTFLAKNFSQAEHYVNIDLHTGLGPAGVDTMLTTTSTDGTVSALPEFLKMFPVVSTDEGQKGGISYKNYGGFPSGLMSLFLGKSLANDVNDKCEFSFLGDNEEKRKARVASTKSFNAITQEFGTYAGISVVKALREENYYFNHKNNNKYTTDNNNSNSSNNNSNDNSKHNIIHWSNQQVLDTFWMKDSSWEQKVVQRGNIVFHQCTEFLWKQQ